MQAAQAESLSPTLRSGTIEDAEECGRIMFEAFHTIGPPDFPSVEVATVAARMLLSHPGFYSVVAEIDGRVAGSNFLDERSPIAGVGPITVDPAAMNRSIGRQLMVAVMDRAEQRHAPGVRLVQTAYHYRSLSLYTKLGFDTRETLSVLQGKPLALQIPGHEVRLATREDLPACNELCRRIHGVDRGGELLDAIGQATVHVVERLGNITGYSTGIGLFQHAVGATNDDLKALIGAAPEFSGTGFLLPSRNGEVFRWCLAKGLRVVSQSTLMTIGLYNEPAGAYLPSITY